MNKLLSVLLPIIFCFGVSSCTSGSVEKDKATESSAESDAVVGEGGEDSEGLIEGETAEGEGLSVESGSEGSEGANGNSEFSDSTDVGEKLADDEGMADDGFSEDGIAKETGESSDSAMSTSPESGSSEDVSPTPEPGMISETGDTGATTGTAIEEGSMPSDSSSSSVQSEGEAPAPKPLVSLKKIANTPYKKNGILVNAVYLARPGDTLAGISKKIYGTNRKSDLLKANPNLKRRVKTGDKVYYNSPRRSTDESQLLVYYEDNGVSPSMYAAQEGDNLKVVSKKLLGHADSWKEIWSTNLDVESKSDLAAGTQLRYWGTDVAVEAPIPQQAESGEGGAQPPNGGLASGTDGGIPPPPPSDLGNPPDDMAANIPQNPPGDFEPGAPPPDAASAGGIEPPPPPPPPPPPSAPGEEGIETKAEEGGGLNDLMNGDPDQTMALGVGALLLFASVALFVMVRKKKRRQSLDFNTSTQTQIE